MKLSKQQINSIPFQYSQDVLDGNIVVGNKIKLAVKRFYQWIDEADDAGYYLDHKAGMKIIDFFPTFLTHTKGPLAGTPFVLSPYQQFTYYNIFAWKTIITVPSAALNNSSSLKKIKTDLRRISTVYEKVGRKNGKTAGLSGLGLAAMSLLGEASPEVYVGATKEAQAKTLWDQAYQFIVKSKRLRSDDKNKGFKTYQREIKYPKSLGSFKFLGGDSKTLDSLNPSVSFIDEYHAHKDDSVREVLESAMGARSNPLVYLITTAGTNVFSVCKQAEDVYVEILEGHKLDDHTFIMIHDLDDGDDWKDEKNWEKANPNLRYNPPMLAHLRKEFIKAENQPSKIPNFKTKHLNMWVDALDVWIPNEIWERNKVTDFQGFDSYEDLFISKCQQFGSFGGIDLSTRKDMTSFDVTTNPDEEGNQYSKTFNYCPEDTIDIRSREDMVPYRYWRDEGWLTSTPGDVIDYNYLLDDIRKHYYLYNIERIEFDQHNASHIMTILLDEGYNVSHFAQGIMNMSFPTKMFERNVYKGTLKHNGNIVVSWALSGCVIVSDPNENIKVHKGKSHKGKKRIDSIIAKIMSFGATLKPEEENNESKYNDPNVKVDFGV